MENPYTLLFFKRKKRFFQDNYSKPKEYGQVKGHKAVACGSCLQAQAHQCRQHHQQGDDLAADVLLLETKDAVDERHDETHAI